MFAQPFVREHGRNVAYVSCGNQIYWVSHLANSSPNGQVSNKSSVFGSDECDLMQSRDVWLGILLSAKRSENTICLVKRFNSLLRMSKLVMKYTICLAYKMLLVYMHIYEVDL